MELPKKSLNMSEVLHFDDHKSAHQHITLPQLTLFLLWISAVLLWVSRISYFKFVYSRNKITPHHNQTTELNPKNQNGSVEINGNALTHDNITFEDVKQPEDASMNKEKNEETDTKNFSNPRVASDIDQILRSVFILGCILLYFFAADYAKIIPKGERNYSRDTFLFLIFLLFLVGSAFTIRKTSDKILNRDQTEEWKGWMQVMFVWYHYFRATEWYNWIRIYIAAYVWMTGFGNFSFFWIKKDFSLWRMLKMLFRLNFLVILLCVVTSNEYMLYYICAMHTYWFLSVYLFMGTLQSWNTHRYKMLLKFVVYAAFNAVIFDIPGVSKIIFRPFLFLLGYNQPTYDLMHEWSFRIGLDHWACFVGMLCAYNYPHFENLLQKLEKDSKTSGQIRASYFIKGATCLVLVYLGVMWYGAVMKLEKFEYNRFHPYTSFIPIIIYVMIRNITVKFRQYYVGLFTFLGKITLETYLSQLHIYMQSNAQELIVYFPDYPLLNFAFVTVIYLVVSYVLFNLTTEFSAYLLPKEIKLLFSRWGKLVLLFMLSAFVSLLFKISLLS